MTREVTYEPLEDYDVPEPSSREGKYQDPRPEPSMEEFEAPRARPSRAKLDEPRLLDHDHGLLALLRDSRRLRFGGRRSTVRQDLDKLLKYYGLWAHQLFPRLTFTDCIRKVESVCHKKRLKVYLREWRHEWSYDAPRPSSSVDTFGQATREGDVFFDSDDEDFMANALEGQEVDPSVSEELHPLSDSRNPDEYPNSLSSLHSMTSNKGHFIDEDKEEDWPEEFSRTTQHSPSPDLNKDAHTSSPMHTAEKEKWTGEEKEQKEALQEGSRDPEGGTSLEKDKGKRPSATTIPSQTPSRKRYRLILSDDDDDEEEEQKVGEENSIQTASKHTTTTPSHRSLAFISDDDDDDGPGEVEVKDSRNGMANNSIPLSNASSLLTTSNLNDSEGPNGSGTI
ncbi:MAG: replication fork protection component Swi3-domain-containing protein [Piptocephalis tieghemiana]|nr:MAG: replication fork protection component Swi3-domain-containing protein [Piptocephalis tieghemiana]